MDIKEKLSNELKETKVLFQCIPAMPVALTVVAVVCMNLLSNKTIVYLDWIGIDAGIFLSWIPFLCMDAITSHFGPKAAMKVSVMALLINLIIIFIFKITALIPTPEDFSNFNMVFNSAWFIVVGSSIAYVISAFINCFSNYAIGNMFKKNPNGKLAYFTKSYVSSILGQFVDNFTFCFIVFSIFAPIYWDGFHWTITQCITSAIIQAIVELISEAIFSSYGYRLCKKWKENKVGGAYFNLRKAS